MMKRKQNKKDHQWSKGNMLCFLFNIDSLCCVSFDHWVFLLCFLLIIDSLCVLFLFDYWLSFCSVSFWSLHNTDYQCWKGNITKRLSMMKRKQNKKTINDEMETEQKDYQWSKGISVFRRVHVSQAFVSSVVLCRSLIVLLFCFLLIIASLFVLFPWKGNKTKRLSMIKRKHSTKTINDQKETEQKDYIW
jgi:hypothetical protein